MKTHVVLKKFSGPDGDIKPGTEVDASEWRNAPLLVKQRYLKALDGVEAPREVSTATFAQQVTEIVLQDIRSNGPIAQELKSFTVVPRSLEDKQKRAQK